MRGENALAKSTSSVAQQLLFQMSRLRISYKVSKSLIKQCHKGVLIRMVQLKSHSFGEESVKYCFTPFTVKFVRTINF